MQLTRRLRWGVAPTPLQKHNHRRNSRAAVLQEIRYRDATGDRIHRRSSYEQGPALYPLLCTPKYLVFDEKKQLVWSVWLLLCKSPIGYAFQIVSEMFEVVQNAYGTRRLLEPATRWSLASHRYQTWQVQSPRRVKALDGLLQCRGWIKGAILTLLLSKQP